MGDARRLKGRGAASNPAGRFGQARSIIARNDSPDIPFEQSVNHYRGCEHGPVHREYRSAERCDPCAARGIFLAKATTSLPRRADMNRIQQLSRDIVRGIIVVPLDEAADASRRPVSSRPRQTPPRRDSSSGTPAPRSTR